MREKEPNNRISDNDESIKKEAYSRESLKKPEYIELLQEIKEDPNSDEIWQKVVTLAVQEDKAKEGQESYYTPIPLGELISIGEKLKSANGREEQYEILAEKSSTGEYWYDIILGHVNDKTFIPVTERLQAITEQQKMEAGLDIGTGLGNTLKAIAPYFNQVVGVDKLSPILKVAKRDDSIPTNAELIEGDATKLPFEDNRFDAAVSNGLTHYLSRDEMQKYVTEVSRVLRPAGMYLESLTVKQNDELLPVIEKEYLTSGKALLVCLADNIVSRNDDENASWSITEMIEEFRDNGLSFVEPDRHEFERGLVVISFVKE